MFRVANFMIRSGLSLLLFSSLVSVPLTAHAELPTAPAPAMPTADVLLQASLVDLADKPVSLRGLTGKVVVVVHQDRHSSEQNPALKEQALGATASSPAAAADRRAGRRGRL
jgi:hypothetical protein